MNYIFDFDGTIADSLPAFVAVFNRTVRSGDNPVTTEEIAELRDYSISKAARALGVRWWQIPKLIVRGMPYFYALVPDLKPCKDIPVVLKSLHERGDKLFIVTSNTKESVTVFLEVNNLSEYFTDISTNAGLYNKSRYIRRLMKRNHLKRSQSVYVGDESRDVKAARLAMIRIASVTWGFNSYKLLKKQRPTYLIDSPKQLLDIKLKRTSSTFNDKDSV